MTSEDKMWENLKAEYLRRVEKALSSVRHPHVEEVLGDVRSHLEQRFAGLKADQRTRKDLEGIIAEMGPASEYAELLSSDTVPPAQRTWRKYLIPSGLIIVIIAGVVLVPMVLSPTAGYIVKFEPVAPFQPQTAKELLKAFNDEVKFRVTTHHFRTEVKRNMLTGYICTNTKADKGAIATILSDSKKLKLISIRPASSKDLEKHYVRGQLSLPGKAEKTKEDSTELRTVVDGSIPLVVSTVPAAFEDSVSHELEEMTVTFNQPMMNLSWSWVGGGDTFPEMTGQPRYNKSKTTCTLPVELEPGKFYWVGINSPQHKYFQTVMGIPAQPYVILFATRDKDGKPTAIPENFIEEAKEINSLHVREVPVKLTQ